MIDAFEAGTFWRATMNFNGDASGLGQMSQRSAQAMPKLMRGLGSPGPVYIRKPSVPSMPRFG
jgi:hypothetical protein